MPEKLLWVTFQELWELLSITMSSSVAGVAKLGPGQVGVPGAHPTELVSAAPSPPCSMASSIKPRGTGLAVLVGVVRVGRAGKPQLSTSCQQEPLQLQCLRVGVAKP